MRYFISAELAYKLQERADRSCYGDDNLFSKKGYIGLFNKNANKTHYFKNPTYHLTKYGWIAERGNCPNYLKKAIKAM